MNTADSHTFAPLSPDSDHDGSAATAADRQLLADVVAIAEQTGARLLTLFDPSKRIDGVPALLAALRANEEAAEPGLRTALLALRPQAHWYDDDKSSAPLDGEWWVVDAVEGNINHVHGTAEWGVSIALVRNGVPVLAVVRQPVGDLTWTAVRGGGARLNGARLQVSSKAELRAAIVATGQAEVGQVDTYRQIGDSITRMLHHALLVRAVVPSTFPMLLVAAGRNDAFWQYRPTLPGVAAGSLFIVEAGGRVTAIDGAAWAPGSPDILATTPQLQPAVIAALTTAR